MMQDWANWALETARVRGSTYADVRVMDIRQRDLSTKNGQVGALSETESLGIGVRVIAAGAWGFASSDRLTREGVEACAAQAVAIARASALAKRQDVMMVPEGAYIDTWKSPCRTDPFRIALEQQLDLLLAADREMGKVAGVTLTETSMQFRRIDELFASSIGSVIQQTKTQSGCGIVATSFAANEIQRRSYPNSFGRQHALARPPPGPRPCPGQLRLRRGGRPRAVHRHHQERLVPRLPLQPRARCCHRRAALGRHYARGELEPPAYHSHDECEPPAGHLAF